MGAPDGGAGSSQHGASTVVSSWVLGADLRLRVRHWCRRHRGSCSHVMGSGEADQRRAGGRSNGGGAGEGRRCASRHLGLGGAVCSRGLHTGLGMVRCVRGC